MPAEWIERSGVFKLGAPLPSVDLRSRLVPMLDDRRQKRLTRAVIDVLEGHANGILESYLIEAGLAGKDAARWSIALRTAKGDPCRALIFSRDPRGVLRSLDALEEEIARWCSERAARAAAALQ